jgi:hypothetical protein
MLIVFVFFINSTAPISAKKNQKGPQILTTKLKITGKSGKTGTESESPSDWGPSCYHSTHLKFITIL